MAWIYTLQIEQPSQIEKQITTQAGFGPHSFEGTTGKVKSMQLYIDIQAGGSQTSEYQLECQLQ
jgi:hypothetical protein